MTTKRQQTMAKITRERNVREKREKKLEVIDATGLSDILHIEQ